MLRDISWVELARRTWREVVADDVFGLAAQLSYYFFLALFPAIVFLLAWASFFELSNVADDVERIAAPVVSSQVLSLIHEQMRRLANSEDGGLLTVGAAGALWSSSAALVSIVGALNRAYDIEEHRPWWKVRLVAAALTIALAITVAGGLALTVAGTALGGRLADAAGLGAPFRWAWTLLQWPVVFALISCGIGMIFYFAPDAEQDWAWVSPGAILATLLWLGISLAFKLYVSHFTDYEGAYGTVGAVVVVLLCLYLSSIALLTGAELNAEIERAAPHGHPPGQFSASGRRVLGARAARAFAARG